MRKKNNFKNILVTGGAGFIGSNFIRHLYNKYPDYRIFNLDLLTYAGNNENLRDLEILENAPPVKKQRYFFLKGDICDEPFVNNILNEYDIEVIVNFAAETHVDRSLVSSRNFIETNVLGTHNLINLAFQKGLKRFVQISTDEVYGDITKGHSKENSPLAATNPYSVTKASADMLVQTYMRAYKLPAVVLRGSNNFGPYQYPEKLIPLSITNLLHKKPIPIHGDGRQVRSWLHVEDFCEAIDLVMHFAPDFSIYNVSGIEKSNKEIVNSICQELGHSFKKSCYFTNDRPGGDSRYSPVSSKIKKELGWKLKKIIDHSISDVVNWYKDRSDWWRPIRKTIEFKKHYEKQRQAKYF